MTDSDPYGFRERFRNASIEQLVESFNADVGNSGWVSARGFFHSALREAFLATGLDCSSFIQGGSISLSHRIQIDGGALVTVPRIGPMRLADVSLPTEDDAVEPCELFYGEGRGGLLFIEPAKALELAAFHEARTWGDFRTGAPSLYRRAFPDDPGDLLAEPDAPADEERFDPHRVDGFADGDFPDFPEQLMLDFIPPSIQRRFGGVVATVHNGPYLAFDSKDTDEILAALRRAGFICVKRKDVIDRIG